MLHEKLFTSLRNDVFAYLEREKKKNKIIKNLPTLSPKTELQIAPL
jgi:hypothetical protein